MGPFSRVASLLSIAVGDLAASATSMLRLLLANTWHGVWIGGSCICTPIDHCSSHIPHESRVVARQRSTRVRVPAGRIECKMSQKPDKTVQICEEISS